MCNLVDDPWIPLSSPQRKVAEHSLRDTLLESHSFSGPVFPTPTLFPAVLRQVLLPVLLDSIGSPRTSTEWSEWFFRGHFDEQQHEAVSRYLDQHLHSFDLFSSQRPFAQVAGLESSSRETKGSALLVPSIATGNNVPLFSSMTEAGTLPLRPAEATWWLLHAHCWDTAAIKTGAAGDPRVKGGKTTGNPTGPLGQLGVIVPTGTTLFETLLLNLPPHVPVPGSLDRPQWRASGSDGQDGEGVASPGSPQWSIRPELGLMDLLTWQSRRVRLVAEERPEGLRVTKVVLCAGDRLSRIPETEPHTAWTWIAKPRKGQSRWRPRRHRPGRALWRGLESLLAVIPPEDRTDISSDTEVTSELLREILELQTDGALSDTYPLRVTSAGVVYGNQSAVVEDVIADEIPLPLSALVTDDHTQEVVTELVMQAEAVSRALDRVDSDLRRANGGSPIPWDKGHHPGAVLLHALDPWARRALTLIQDHADHDDRLEEVMEAWEKKVWQLSDEHAQRLLDAAPAQVFSGRKVDNRVLCEATVHRYFRAALYKNLTRQAEQHRAPAPEGN